jgi:hypothetical protein
VWTGGGPSCNRRFDALGRCAPRIGGLDPDQGHQLARIVNGHDLIGGTGNAGCVILSFGGRGLCMGFERKRALWGEDHEKACVSPADLHSGQGNLCLVQDPGIALGPPKAGPISAWVTVASTRSSSAGTSGSVREVLARGALP